MDDQQVADAHRAPTVRLAMPAGTCGSDNLESLLSKPGPPDSRPALLVSFMYMDRFLSLQHKYNYRSWVLDSGAFTAHSSGNPIDLQAYIEFCQQKQAEDPTLQEIFALDVIGDWKASLKNTEAMWEAGIQAIPCFHAHEPWDALEHLARSYPKIALGGVALMKTGKKLAWAQQCFARVWPKKIHGFGFGTEKSILGLPFHSTDSTNWSLGPVRFGNWVAYGGKSLRVPTKAIDLQVQVDYFLELEAKARARWKREMERLERLPQQTPSR